MLKFNDRYINVQGSLFLYIYIRMNILFISNTKLEVFDKFYHDMKIKYPKNLYKCNQNIFLNMIESIFYK